MYTNYSQTAVCSIDNEDLWMQVNSRYDEQQRPQMKFCFNL